MHHEVSEFSNKIYNIVARVQDDLILQAIDKLGITVGAAMIRLEVLIQQDTVKDGCDFIVIDKTDASVLAHKHIRVGDYIL